MNEKPNLQKVLELSRALAAELKKGVRIINHDAQLTDEGREAFAVAVRHVWGATSRGTRGRLGRSCGETWGRDKAFHLALLLAEYILKPNWTDDELREKAISTAYTIRMTLQKPAPPARFPVELDRRTREYRRSLKPSQPPEGPRVC